MAATIQTRGEGGHVIDMSVPLPGHYRQRIARGELVILDGQGSPLSVEAGLAAAYPAPADDAGEKPARRKRTTSK